MQVGSGDEGRIHYAEPHNTYLNTHITCLNTHILRPCVLSEAPPCHIASSLMDDSGRRVIVNHCVLTPRIWRHMASYDVAGDVTRAYRNKVTGKAAKRAGSSMSLRFRPAPGTPPISRRTPCCQSRANLPHPPVSGLMTSRQVGAVEHFGNLLRILGRLRGNGNSGTLGAFWGFVQIPGRLSSIVV